MTDLLSNKCIPCKGNIASLTKEQAEMLLAQVSDWKLADDAKSISKTFRLSTFTNAIAFVDKIAVLAEIEQHHPEMCISYRKVTCTLTTHALHGLSENDFILAAKINRLVS